MSVSQSHLHDLQNDLSKLNVASGVHLTDLQKYHVALVLDLFQAKGTMAKMIDGFSDDAIYEDLFAKAKNRDEIAGQLLHLPTIMSSAKTEYYNVISVKPAQTTDGSGKDLSADEIDVEFKHTFTPIGPLPESVKSVTMNSTLVIYSSSTLGKIVRLQDRPKDNIPNNAILNLFRKLNAVGAPKVAGLPKDEKEDAEKALKQGI